jgi:hypothetical protein
MIVEFLDKTALTLGPDARLEVDTYVYDPKSGNGQSVFKLAVGIFRFVSGKMVQEHVRIETPSSLIGIRGSDAVIVVSPDGATSVNVQSGEFAVANQDGGDQVAVGPGMAVSVSSTGQVGAVTTGTPGIPSSLDVSTGTGGGGTSGQDDGSNGDGDQKTVGLDDDHHHDDDDDYDPSWEPGSDDDDHPDDDHPDDGHDGGDGGDGGGH